MGLIESVDSLEVYILSDNTTLPAARGVIGEHGFSALIKHGEEAVLFDSGQTGLPLINNMKVFGIEAVEDLVFSHGHYDHSGGLPALIREGRAPSRLITHKDAFLPRYKKVRGKVVDIGMPYGIDLLESSGVEVAVPEAPFRAKRWLATTGEVARLSFEVPETEFFIGRGGGIEKDGFRDDMGVIAAVEGKGLVVITGCAHSGVINTVIHARKVAGVQEVYAVIGGFHLNDAGRGKVDRTAAALKEMGVKRVIPCHCTGFEAMCRMCEMLGNAVEPGGAGMRIVL